MDELRDMGAGILDAIEKNIPAAVGEVLKKELEELKRLRGVEADRNRLRKDLEQVLETNRAHDTLSARKVELAVLQEKLESKERDMKVTILEVKLDEANKRADVVTMLVKEIFRQPTLVRSIQGSLPAGIVDGTNGCMGYAATAPINTVETVTQT